MWLNWFWYTISDGGRARTSCRQRVSRPSWSYRGSRSWRRCRRGPRCPSCSRSGGQIYTARRFQQIHWLNKLGAECVIFCWILKTWRLFQKRNFESIFLEEDHFFVYIFFWCTIRDLSSDLFTFPEKVHFSSSRKMDSKFRFWNSLLSYESLVQALSVIVTTMGQGPNGHNIR